MKIILMALLFCTVGMVAHAASVSSSVCMIDYSQGTLTVVCDGKVVKTVAADGDYPDFLVKTTTLEQQYVAQGYRIVGFTNDQGITIILERD